MTVLLLMAFVIVPVGDTHLHFCFDGQEPPVSLHLVHGDLHHAPSQLSGTLDDVDLSVPGEMVAKKFERSLDSDALFAVAVVLLMPSIGERLRILRFENGTGLSSLILRLRPPLRGPPR